MPPSIVLGKSYRQSWQQKRAYPDQLGIEAGWTDFLPGSDKISSLHDRAGKANDCHHNN
jgi:hypothetical protein